MKRLYYVTISLVLLILSGCSTTKEENENNVMQFIDKQVIKEKEDGWVSYLYIQVEKIDKNSKAIEGNYDLNKIMNVYYDSVNLRYQSLKGYTIKETNEDGEEIGEIEKVIPTYSRSLDKGKDIKNINDFLSDKKFNREITVKDLDKVECDSLDKKEIVEMYNEALHKKMELEPQEYSYGMNKEISSGEIKLSNGGKLYVAYLVTMDKIADINIEYINTEGEYLSTLYDEGNVSEKEKEIKLQLDDIEKSIINKQKIIVEKNIEGIPQFKQKINELLKEIILVEKME